MARAWRLAAVVAHGLILSHVAAATSDAAAEPPPCTIFRDDDLRTSRMDCSASQVSQLRSIPPAAGMAANVTEIFIEDQPLLTELSWATIGQYTKLYNLTVRRCGVLRLVDTPVNITSLKILDLQHNNLEVVSWELIVPLKLRNLYLAGNPLACNCSSKWIQTLLQKNANEIQKQLTCRDSSGLNRNLRYMDLTVCQKPTGDVRLLSTRKVKVGDTFSASCSFTGDSPLTYRWVTEGLRAYVEVTNTIGSSVISLFNITRRENRLGLTCSARNHVGRGNASVTVEMEMPPNIDTLGPLNSRAFYKCLPFGISGTDPMNMEWSKDGSPLVLDGVDWDGQIGNAGPDVVSGCLTTKGPYLRGVYTLTVSNTFGQDSRTIEVTSEVPASRPVQGLPGRGSQTVSSADDESDAVELGSLTGNTTPITVGSQQEVKAVGIVAASVIGLVLLILALVGVVARSGRHAILSRACKVHWPSKRASRKPGTQGRRREDARRTSMSYDPVESSEGSSDRREHSVSQREVWSLSENPHYYQHKPKRPVNLRQIAIEQLTFIHELGEGAFGRVYLGSCSHLTSGDEITMVAIKTLKNASLDSSWSDFQRESEMMADMHHDNIVTFYGACYSHDGTMMMVFEYMENGDLNKYLRSRGPDAGSLLLQTTTSGRREEREEPSGGMLSLAELLLIARQVAAGVAFLASRHFVHRDLATRNCLVGNKLIVKIGDFGMCRDVYSTDYYRVGGTPMLPIRWMPPESILYRHFTVESDIWSFGVVLWEIFTYGRQPWFELSNNEVITCILEGRLLDRPALCTPEIYKMMTGCWERLPNARKPVEQVLSQLTAALHQVGGALYNSNVDDAPTLEPDPSTGEAAEAPVASY